MVALAVGLGGAFFAERPPAPSVEPVVEPMAQLPAQRPAPVEPLSAMTPSPSAAPALAEDLPPPSVVAGGNAPLHYDDSHLYRREAPAQRLPASVQGVLTAFDRSRAATSQCLSAARRKNPTLTNLMTLDVRVAAQGDGTAAIEELRLPTSNDPALDFRGCLVAALADERFDVPSEGFVRLTLPLELAEPTP
jgi:hypothetical protein